MTTPDYLAMAREAHLRFQQQQSTYVRNVSNVETPDHSSGEGFTLKGHAIELWRAGDRFVLVHDEADREAALALGIGSPGELWTSDEVELVALIEDQVTRDEVERWKRTTGGRVRDVLDHRGQR